MDPIIGRLPSIARAQRIVRMQASRRIHAARSVAQISRRRIGLLAAILPCQLTEDVAERRPIRVHPLPEALRVIRGLRCIAVPVLPTVAEVVVTVARRLRAGAVVAERVAQSFVEAVAAGAAEANRTAVVPAGAQAAVVTARDASHNKLSLSHYADK